MGAAPLHHRRVTAALLLALAMTPAGAAEISDVTLARPEGARHYLLAQPLHAAAGKHPLVLLLHGHGGSAAQMLGRQRGAAPLSLWLEIADREGLLLAAPDGLVGPDGLRGWNDCRADNAGNPRSDDVALLSAIVAREVAEHDADPARIYAMGMSNGGMMSFRLAIEWGGRLAAFATVGASMAAQSACPAPTVAVPALIVHGTADPLVPYRGGPVGFAQTTPRGTVIGIDDAVAVWRRLARLPDEPTQTEPVPHRDAGDPTHITRFVWGNPGPRLQVGLLRVDQGGHVEPSARQRFGRAYLSLAGRQNADLETAEEAWRFFGDKRAAP